FHHTGLERKGRIGFGIGGQRLRQGHRIVRRVSQRRHSAEVLEHRLARRSLARDRRQVVLHYAILATRAANHLTQLEILVHPQLLVARDEQVFHVAQILTQRLEIFLLIVLLFHGYTCAARPPPPSRYTEWYRPRRPGPSWSTRLCS